MNGQAHKTDCPTDLVQEERRDLRSYARGVVLALLLTLVPFALLYWGLIPRFWLLIVVSTFALIQALVHFRFFLHVSLKHKREDLLLLLFSALLLAIMVGGTIWIMASLSIRMGMPL